MVQILANADTDVFDKHSSQEMVILQPNGSSRFSAYRFLHHKHLHRERLIASEQVRKTEELSQW